MKARTKFYLRFFFFLSAFLVCLVLPFLSMERNLIRIYMNKVDMGGEVIVLEVEEGCFKERQLWPWEKRWPYYLLSYLLDLKPRMLVIGPGFLKGLVNYTDLAHLFKDKRVYLAFDQSLEASKIDFSGHLEFKELGGDLFLIHPRLKEKYAIGLLIGGKLNRVKIEDGYLYLEKGGRKIAFPGDLPLYLFYQGSSPKRINASSLALRGFLKEGFSLNQIPDRFWEDLEGKIIFLEREGTKLEDEIKVLSSQISGSFFCSYPRIFALYIGISLFILLFVLFKHFKPTSSLVLFPLISFFCLLLHRAYFELTLRYVELLPILSFGFIALCLSLTEKELERRVHLKERRENQLARMLKEKEVLPASALTSDGILVNITRFKMDKVGGDFYQFLEFSKGEIGILLGWAPGEGLERVKYIIELVHSWRDFASIYKEPGKVIQVLNNSLYRYAEEAKYATLTYMLYDAKKGSLRYVNAGHDPLLYISRRERQTRVLEAEDPTPVGVARDILFLEEEIYLDPGDMLIGYSGGISDLIYKEGGFKLEFLNGLKDYLNQKPDQLVDEVFQDLLKFYPDKPREEWSLLILKIMG